MSETRGEAIMRAVDEVQRELLPGDEAGITVCAGPPLCLLQDDEAVEAGARGCPHCSRFTVGESLPRA